MTASRKHFMQKTFSLTLSCLLLGQAFAAGDVLTGDVRVTISPANIRESIPVSGADRKVTMAFRGVAIQDALRALAKKGGFNVLIDESVSGTVSVDLNNVTIQDALETIKTYGHLAYSVQGRNLMVAAADSEKGQSFKKSATRIFPLRNANAKVIADLLNSTIFVDEGNNSGNTQNRVVTPDFHTNSLIVVGTPREIKTVEMHIAALDQPREMRTWRLSHANVLDAASILSSSLFNEGQAGGTASTIRVTAENLEEGKGTSDTTASGGSSGSGSGSSSVMGSMTLRGRVKESQTLNVSPNGAIIIPDTRLNTLTLLGTAEQIAMAEALIPTLDRKVPQVILEASLVEVSETGRKELGFSSGSNGFGGRFSSGTNNTSGSTLINRAFSNTIGRTTSSSDPLESILRFTTNPSVHASNFTYQLNALISKNKAKMLAHPTVITTSDNETVISIVDEIIQSVSITQGLGVPATATHNIGQAGIVLNLLPKVGADGTISLRVRPAISTIAGTQTDRFGNLITLLSKREVLAQNVSLKDGESFVLGGLIHNTNSEAITRNPMLSRLPIVGALARNSTNSKARTELVIMITPHIVNDDSRLARTLMPSLPKTSPAGEDGMIPVSLTGPAKRSALPALEGVHTLGGTSALPERGERIPLLPDELVPASDNQPLEKPKASAVTPARVSATPVHKPTWTPAVTAPKASLPTSSSDVDTSDAAIRAIIERFK